jgi:hypothetical protein
VGYICEIDSIKTKTKTKQITSGVQKGLARCHEPGGDGG